MWRLATAFFLAVAALPSAAPGPKDLPKEPSIVGQWRLVKANGERPVFPQLVTFGADGSWVTRTSLPGKEVEDKARFATNFEGSPAAIDLICDRSDSTQTLAGIFKIDGLILTVCYQTGKGDRPSEFKEVKNVISLFVYERIKPKE